MKQLPIREINFEDIELNTRGIKNGRSSVGDVRELQSSIEENGLDSPLIVWEPEDGVYVLIAGYRRHASISKIRETVDAFEKIHVSVFDGTVDEAHAKNLEENIQRQNLNPADEAEAVTALYDKVGDQTDVGRMLGKSQPWVSQRISLYNGLIPRGLEYLRAGTINLKQATSISKLLKADKTPNEDAQHEVLDKIDEGKDADVKVPTERSKTYRTKKEVEELGKMVADNSDEIEPTQAAVLDAVISWFRCEIDSDTLLFDSVEVEEEEDVEEEDLVDTEAEAPARRRIVVGE